MQVGVADLKARLSHYIGLSRAGEEVLITDRGRPVAKLAPLAPNDVEIPPHLLDMERRGELKIGSGQIPEAVRQRRRPRVRSGASAVQALIDERDEGR